MKLRRRMIATLMAVAMVATTLVGCGSNSAATTTDPATEETTETAEAETETESTGEIKEFTAFHAVPGTELADDNRIMMEVANRIGAYAKETWLTGQTAEEAVGTLIAGGEYPDFITGSTGTPQLIDAGALVPLDEYWDDYPNIKNYLTESEWNRVRSEDGHVYIMPQFGIINDHDVQPIHWDEAWWIQLRVLKWAGYPEIVTMDDYFKVIEDYIAANPTMEDGTPNIGYEILCDDWRYFCLENAPFFLDGHPNNGSCIVDPVTLKVTDYNTTPTAKKYFAKLNEEYQKGIVDPETFTMNYDQYIAKLSTGRVCGMIDQYWNFQPSELSIKQQGYEDCVYVPVGVVAEEGIVERYHSSSALDVSNGLAITVSCDDVEGALKYINDLLSQEIQTLVNWGIEGEDYTVGEDGLYVRTQQNRDDQENPDWKISNWCDYAYFPHYEGMNLDGVNAYSPAYQPSEYFANLTPEMQECLEAYGVQTQVQLLNESGENEPYYPMWSYSNTWTADTEYGIAKVNMDEVKHAELPKVVMADDFDSAWDSYLATYNERVDIDSYIKALEEEVARRVAVAAGE